MAKSQNLNFTQNINHAFVDIFSSDTLSVVSVSTNSVGSNLSDGTRTFTAAAGTLVSGASAATWTATVLGSRIVGGPVITNTGNYTVTPTAASNAATVDTGSTNATWNLRVEILKPLYTGSTNDAIVKSINVSSHDTAARVMSLWLVDPAQQPILMGAVNIPLRSGDNGTAAAIDLLGGTLMPSLPYDANGKRVLPLKAGQQIMVSVPAVTAGTQINVSAIIEEY
jgi:hypothetical protein